ncbi:MAG: type ISP restriction/modification enzyme [Rhizomicrobium sp.]|jgi:predicted helicase
MANTISHQRDALRNIRTFPQLVKFLRDELEWPIASENFEELTFDYTPEELGIDSANAAKIQEIKRLRPLAAGQPWGIFFVKFEPKRLPVVALRRVLSRVVLKKRASANSADRAAWQADDLLFISNYGEGTERQISFAHFSQDGEKADLPTLKVLGWDNRDTPLHLDDVAGTLHEKLSWPDDDRNSKRWRDQWKSAFTLRHGEVISTSKDLAVRLADLARTIRDRIQAVLKIETENGPLTKLMKAFRQALIHDLSAEDFADMYAQTIAYGLLSARVANPAHDTADAVATHIPVTNPFLKELMETFLHIGGRKHKQRGGNGIDFDELGVSEVVELLDAAKMEAVVRDFGDRNRDEDPVIHFYELFLKEYDARKRMQRGVFYTPQPVVSYIVRSVHELLQSEFGLEDGLASTVTWGEIAESNARVKKPEGANPAGPFVAILDPATGTATFLVEVIDVIHRTLTVKWKGQRLTDAQQRNAWNDYVPKHLLPRLYGYELLMAPYAIAHMKIGLKLYETGYNFESDERARIYLTNALEPPSDDNKQREFAQWAPALAREAQAVNAVKREHRFTVVIGNPPYAGISSNMTEHAQKIVDAYRIVDGEALNERKLWLQDDYVKFTRTAQITLENTGSGILGYITNHGYLDNPTFRGMRQSLMTTFQRVRVLDLHGNANKKEQSPNGSDDKNVFDIRQGVAICLATRNGAKPSVEHADLWGTREVKYLWLSSHSVTDTPFSLLGPDSPYYFFEPQNTDRRAEYDRGWKINEAMPVNSAGFITARDHFVIDFDRNTLLTRIADFADPTLSDAKVRAKYFAGHGSDKYPDGDTRGWKVPAARLQVRADKAWRTRVRTCLYRPFDEREVYWTDWMVDWPRPDLTRNLDLKGNKALITTRITKDLFSVFVTTNPPGHKSVGAYDVNYVFPLMSAPTAGRQGSLIDEDSRPQPNFSPKFLKAIAATLQLPQQRDFDLPLGLSQDDIFHYVYAVFHSPGYGSRYAEFLKNDFPRLPLTPSVELFRALAQLGTELVGLHLMESPALEKSSCIYRGTTNPEVGKISFGSDTVWLDKEQTCGFKGVPESVWNFHIGGYQVCEKWLKDRRRRTLSKDDIVHYQKIVVALDETIRLMDMIDEVIEKYGGWPNAFLREAEKHLTG